MATLVTAAQAHHGEMRPLVLTQARRSTADGVDCAEPPGSWRSRRRPHVRARERTPPVPAARTFASWRRKDPAAC